AVNVWEAILDTKIFLGEYLDFQLKAGEKLLQARVHPSLRIDVGQKVYLEMEPEKCIALRNPDSSSQVVKVMQDVSGSDDSREVS
ncbi:TOBE domain-containing protein, partial [Effusibacillus lacus]